MHVPKRTASGPQLPALPQPASVRAVRASIQEHPGVQSRGAWVSPPLKCVNMSPRGSQDSLPTIRQVLLCTALHGTLARSVRIVKQLLPYAAAIAACLVAPITYAAWESTQGLEPGHSAQIRATLGLG